MEGCSAVTCIPREAGARETLRNCKNTLSRTRTGMSEDPNLQLDGAVKGSLGVQWQFQSDEVLFDLYIPSLSFRIPQEDWVDRRDLGKAQTSSARRWQENDIRLKGAITM